MKNTIAGQWKLFEDIAMPHNAQYEQRIEMRRAFYAGAYALLGIQCNIDASKISAWINECEEFFIQVKAGKA